MANVINSQQKAWSLPVYGMQTFFFILVLIGQTAKKIAETAKKHGFHNIVFEDDLLEAVKYCHENAKDGEAVLLSPACASWGMFDNYEQRGRMFKEYVRDFKE